MNDSQVIPSEIAAAAGDVFRAAHWLDSQWNSSAKAVSATEVAWQCDTWGSGRGRGDWIETANFRAAAAAFDLDITTNIDGRDELVVTLPLDQFPKLAAMLARLGDEPEAWPSLLEDDRDDQIAVAAGGLAMSFLRRGQQPAPAEGTAHPVVGRPRATLRQRRSRVAKARQRFWVGGRWDNSAHSSSPPFTRACLRWSEPCHR
ncbi:hypothetical protein [Pedococcus sp. P5_B7]